MFSAAARFLGFIRFSHTVFAMPFALGAAFVAAEGVPAARVLGLILLCMVAARTAAMCFNRLADWEIDKRNPRTSGRHLLASKSAAKGVLALSCGMFVASAAFINPLCLALSPVALALVFFYSLTKHFTHYTQLALGLALAASPVGAWVAVQGAFALPPLILALAVLLWVAGFDLIYAAQDVEFDRGEGLRSMVVLLGVSDALRLAGAMHAGMLVALALFGLSAGLGLVYFSSLLPVAAALVYEHRSAKAFDLQGINRAFFQSNAFVGVVFVAGTVLDVLL